MWASANFPITKENGALTHFYIFKRTDKQHPYFYTAINYAIKIVAYFIQYFIDYFQVTFLLALCVPKVNNITKGMDKINT